MLLMCFVVDVSNTVPNKSDGQIWTNSYKRMQIHNLGYSSPLNTVLDTVSTRRCNTCNKNLAVKDYWSQEHPPNIPLKTNKLLKKEQQQNLVRRALLYFFYLKKRELDWRGFELSSFWPFSPQSINWDVWTKKSSCEHLQRLM